MPTTHSKTPKVSIVVINYNTVDLLFTCLTSLQDVVYSNKEFFVIDQGSSDDSVEMVRKKFPHVKVIENKNTGYAGGANKAYEVTDGEYLIVMNPDVTLEKDYIDILVKKLEKDQSIGAITGKILKTKPTDPELLKNHTPLIDTTGLLAFKNRRVVDRGQGFEDKGQFEKEEEVFGISGCLAMYRRKALDDISIPMKIFDSQYKNSDETEVWDNDFFMYKEDIDVSWRLNLYGWKCVYTPDAVAYHQRGTQVLKRYTNKDVLKHRKSVSHFTRYFSYKNQNLMQVKNEIWSDVMKDILSLIMKEILITGYIVLREPKTGKAFLKLIVQLPRALKKRNYIQKHRKLSSMRHFLKGSPKDAFKGWEC